MVALALLAPACGGDGGSQSDGNASSETVGTAGETGGHVIVQTRRLLPPDAADSLQRIADRFGGRLGVAVAPLGSGPVEVAGDLASGRAWSTMKVPLLVALVDRLGGWNRLSSEERAQAELAITRSDNDAALALFDRLQELEGGLVPASRAIEDVLRASGDSRTHVNTEPNEQGFSTFGQTIWPAEASAEFMGALAVACLLPDADTTQVLSLMERVAPDQRWGLGEAGYPSDVRLAFKGGWGPEPDGGYLVRQIGVAGELHQGLVTSILALAPGAGSSGFATGREMVTAAARWLERTLGTGRPRAPSAPCPNVG